MRKSNKASAFYEANYPSVNYGGFVGLERNTGLNFDETGKEKTVQKRSEQPYYMVIQHVEPVVGTLVFLCLLAHD